MRIALDVRPALTKNSRRRGIGKYTIELTRALLANADDRYAFSLYGCGEEPLDLGDSLDQGRHVYRSIFRLSKPGRLAWIPDRFVLPRVLAEDRVDIYHTHDIGSIAFRKGTKTIATVHDVIPLIFWKEMRPNWPVDYRFALRQAFRRAARCDLVLTDSAHSKADICQRLGLPEDKVRVILPGLNPRFSSRDQVEAGQRIRQKFRVPPPFLLYVGGSDFRKNLPRLVEAFSEIRRTGYQGSLVLAGETFHWDIEEVRQLRALIARFGIGDSVLFPGYVEDDDLPDFYSACDAFIFPSLYEGFGLPVIEALACGAVSLVSRASSIPEAAGEAAEYFDPLDVGSLVRAFIALQRDPRRREELRRKGLEQARKFSWDEAARQTLAAYDSVHQGDQAGR